jgi:uncharacterized protein with HEPN domain
MPYRDWRLHLEDILEAIGKIERYSAGMDFEQFQADEKTADAVVRNLEIIGEASRHIPREVQERNPNIPWDKMRGIRNVLVHEYFRVSLPIIWQTLKEDLPPLVPLLSEVLHQSRKHTGG